MIRHAVVLVAALVAAPAFAQPTGLGVGGQVGDPTGITMRIGSPGTALDLAAGWNLGDNRFFAQLHVILAQPRLSPGAQHFRLFYGPGGFVGVRGGRDRDSEAAFGASFNVGVSYYTGPIEIFGQLTPRLQLVQSTDFDLGGAIGLRYYF